MAKTVFTYVTFCVIVYLKLFGELISATFDRHQNTKSQNLSVLDNGNQEPVELRENEVWFPRRRRGEQSVLCPHRSVPSIWPKVRWTVKPTGPLASRLRSIASVSSLAAEYVAAAEYVWERDTECPADFDELFSRPRLTLSSADCSKARRMETRQEMCWMLTSVRSSQKHVCHAAVNPALSPPWSIIWWFRQLRPSASVADMVREVEVQLRWNEYTWVVVDVMDPNVTIWEKKPGKVLPLQHHVGDIVPSSAYMYEMMIANHRLKNSTRPSRFLLVGDSSHVTEVMEEARQAFHDSKLVPWRRPSLTFRNNTREGLFHSAVALQLMVQAEYVILTLHSNLAAVASLARIKKTVYLGMFPDNGNSMSAVHLPGTS
uniref:Uncharacterized protein n=1 Tax=Tetraselmis sp. GSL018 TaxID=582737 RepID=A0A061RIR2_9CHLO